MRSAEDMPGTPDEPEEARFDLVMPFTVCASNGGPYDDDAFAAGYETGWLDLMLSICGKAGAVVRRTVRSELVPQLDLVAMRHGYVVVTDGPMPGDDQPEWTTVTFEQATDDALR